MLITITVIAITLVIMQQITLIKKRKKEITEANGGAVAPGTFNNSEAAHNYANEEINRLAKRIRKTIAIH